MKNIRISITFIILLLMLTSCFIQESSYETFYTSDNIESIAIVEIKETHEYIDDIICLYEVNGENISTFVSEMMKVKTYDRIIASNYPEISGIFVMIQYSDGNIEFVSDVEQFIVNADEKNEMIAKCFSRKGIFFDSAEFDAFIVKYVS